MAKKTSLDMGSLKRKGVLDYKKIKMLTMLFLVRLDFSRLPGPIVEPFSHFLVANWPGEVD